MWWLLIGFMWCLLVCFLCWSFTGFIWLWFIGYMWKYFIFVMLWYFVGFMWWQVVIISLCSSKQNCCPKCASEMCILNCHTRTYHKIRSHLQIEWHYFLKETPTYCLCLQKGINSFIVLKYSQASSNTNKTKPCSDYRVWPCLAIACFRTQIIHQLDCMCMFNY